jgi:acyl-CoA thioesterase-1
MVAKGYGAIRGVRNGFAVTLLLAGGVAAEPVTVVALGDSLTAGYGLADQTQGFVPVLEDTTAGGLARVAWALGPDADALIVTLGGNDLLRGLDPAASKASLDGILKEAATRKLPVLLVSMKAPGNFGPEYKAAFDGMYGELAATYGTLLADDFFGGLRAAGADPTDPASMTAFMQADGLHPNPEGVKLIVEGLGPKVEELLAKAGD